MKYVLTLSTDEYTLTGEVYEREDGKGYEYRLRYSYYYPTLAETVERVWDSKVVNCPTDYKFAREQMIYDVVQKPIEELLTRIL